MPKIGITFFTDEDVSGIAIKSARHQGVSIVTIHDAGLRTANDDQIPFDYAVEHGYVLVTANCRDHEKLLYAFLETGQDHPGLICIRPAVRQAHAYIAAELVTYHEISMSPDDFKNRRFDIE